MSKKSKVRNIVATNLGISADQWDKMPVVVQEAVSKAMQPKKIQSLIFNPVEYKGFNIIAQKIGNVFQYFIYYKVTNEWFNAHNVIMERNAEYTEAELDAAGKNIIAQAFATCDLILKTQEEIKEKLSTAHNDPSKVVN